jgi:phosphoglucosamine mutase
MGTFFGTDGVRGIANQKLTPELAYVLGRVGGYTLTRNNEGRRPKIVIARDTRISGPMLEAALVAGLLSIGADVVRLGILPTPGVAYLTKQLKADAGIMISASHNPAQDNGIKFFGADGFKLSDVLEAEMESLMDGREDQLPRPIGADVGTVQDDLESGRTYIEYLKTTVTKSFQGLKVVVDCANGAASSLAPLLFAELGAEPILLAHEPDGLNINQDCGSTHPDHVRRAVLEHQADIGLSFDGDADRLIVVDEKGNILDGDHILYVLATYMAKHQRLQMNTVVSTVMSNLGFDRALQQQGLELQKSKVGDRYVMEEMLEGGCNLGGEQSGHIIMLDYSTTGDGMLSAIQLVNVILSESQPLSKLASPMVKYPQLLVNVHVENKYKLEGNRKIEEAIRYVESKMGAGGRVLVRPSGTESLVRVMAEGVDEQELITYVDGIVEVVKEELVYRAV